MFSAGVQTERHAPLATCAVFLSVGWCPNVAAPNTSWGSLAVMTTSAETALGGLYALETSLSPRTVLCTGVAARVPCASASQARGRGSPRQRDTPIAPRQEPAWRSKHRPQDPGTRASVLLRVPCRSATGMTEPDTQAAPVVVPWGVRLLRSAPWAVEQLAPSERGWAR